MQTKLKNFLIILGIMIFGGVSALAIQNYFFMATPQIVSAQVGTWDASSTYVKGDCVTFEGKTYEAKWWTRGEKPDAHNEWGVWKIVVDGLNKTEQTTSKTWDKAKVYNSGDRVEFAGKTYEAKWWTQGEKPDPNVLEGVWMIVKPTASSKVTKPSPLVVRNGEQKFKVVGYYPDWQPDKINMINYAKLTHINYAFAIPTVDGDLRPLANPTAAQTIIDQGHKQGVKVLLAIGGWSYRDTPLDETFKAATATDEKCKRLAENIIATAKQYGFDGVDMDWEHPHTGEKNARQYADLMKYLSQGLHQENMLLTAAVLGGKTADGITQYDAAAHTDAVIECVDWLNIMAYDGGDGERHSSYDFAIACAGYWKDERGIAPEKLVLGVPFYGRPSWSSYAELLKADAAAAQQDCITLNGQTIYYNGIYTIKNKTRWAIDNLGGIMIWELSQDSDQLDHSLLQAIGQVIDE